MQAVLHSQAKKYARPVPELRPGYTVRVHQKIQEGGKERIQIFEGLVISVHNGHVPTDRTFTVRRIVQGIGVEKIFPVLSPNIAKIEVVKVASVRRAKLFFLRGRRGKASRLSERFTTADEFAVAAAVEPQEEESAETASDSPSDAAEEKASSQADESTEETEKAEEADSPKAEKEEEKKDKDS